MSDLYDDIMKAKRISQEIEIKNKEKIKKIMKRMESRIEKKLNSGVDYFSVSVMRCVHHYRYDYENGEEKLQNYYKACDLLVEKLYSKGIKNAYVNHNLNIEECDDVHNSDEEHCNCSGINIYKIPNVPSEYDNHIEKIVDNIMRVLMQNIKNTIKKYMDLAGSYHTTNCDYSECNASIIPRELNRMTREQLHPLFVIARLYCIDNLMSYGFRAIVDNCYGSSYIRISNIKEVWNSICLNNSQN